MQDFGIVVKREDGSYVILKNNLPYHVPNFGEFEELFKEVHAYVLANPANTTEEEFKMEDFAF